MIDTPQPSPELPPPPPWLLYDGPGHAVVEGETHPVDTRIWFTTREGPELRFEMRTGDVVNSLLPSFDDAGDPEPQLADGLNVAFGGDPEEGPSSASRQNVSGEGWSATGRCPPMTGGDGGSLDLLRVHLVNFSADSRRRHLTIDQWEVTIRSLGTTPMRHGYTVTDVIDISRSDGDPFSYDDTERLRAVLLDALTFASGRHVGFAVAQGFVAGAPVFVDGRSTKTGEWVVRRSWWDERTPSDADLQELCSRWNEAARAEGARVWMRRAAGAYTRALAPDPLDIAIVVAGIGIELLTWESLRERLDLVPSDEFERMSFATRIRLVLELGAVPAAIPHECSSLVPYIERLEIRDGPAAFAEARNRLVHPPKRTMSCPAGDVMTEAWMLGCEYLALLLLRSIEFEGSYRSQFEWNGWPSSEIPTPWGAGDE